MISNILKKTFLGAYVIYFALLPALAVENTNPDNHDIEYRLRVGDMIEVFLWQSNELSRDVTVQPNGKISYPLAGDMEAAGKTLSEVSEMLTRGLSPYMTDPRIWLNIKQYAEQRFNIIGEVRNPGTYNLKYNQTLLDAVSTAGGFTSNAAPVAKILRTHGQKKQTEKINVTKIIESKTNDVPLLPGDIVYIPSAKWTVWNTVLGQILPSLTAFSLIIAIIRVI